MATSPGLIRLQPSPPAPIPPTRGLVTKPLLGNPLEHLLKLLISKSMAVKVLIPTTLQKFTDNKALIECSAGNVAELLDSLEINCPGIKGRLCDDQGKPRRFLNFYVNSEDIRFLDGTNTQLSDGDEVSIVPAVAGG